MEKAKRKHTLPNRLIAFMLTFAMIVSVLTGVLPGSEMTAEAATGSETIPLKTTGSNYSRNDTTWEEVFTGTRILVSRIATGRWSDSDGMHSSDGPIVISAPVGDYITSIELTRCYGQSLEKRMVTISSGNLNVTANKITVTGINANSFTITVEGDGYDEPQFSPVVVNYTDSLGYDVTVTPGSNMTKTSSSGAASQTGVSGAITPVVYTANTGYYFPTNYSVAAVNGISVTRNSYTQITVSGTPTANASIALTAPTAKTKPDAPTTVSAANCTTAADNDGKLIGVTTAMEYQKSGASSWTVGTGSDITGLSSGTYNVRFKATDTTLASDSQVLTIKPVQVITAADVAATYGDTDKSVSATVTTPATGGGAISYAVKDGSGDYIDVDATNGALTIKKVPADGKAYVVVTAAETSTYAQATKEVTVTIDKAAAVPATVAANNSTYDGSEKSLVTVTGEVVGGKMQYALGTNGTTAPTTDWAETVPSKTDAGTYYVWYRVDPDDNHYFGDPVVVSADGVKIAQLQAKLSWTVTTLEYNGKEQLPEVIVSNAAQGDDVKVDLTGAATEVGYYYAHYEGLSGKAAKNYSDPAEGEKSRLYSIVKESPKISVSINDWTYGDTASKPVVDGLPEGKTALIEYKAQDENVFTETVPVSAGKYTIRATLTGDNSHETVTAVYNFSILPKEVSLKWENIAFTYDGAYHAPSAKLGDTIVGDAVQAEVAGAAKEAGEHVATVTGLTGAAASNYKLPANTKQSFTIAKATLPDEGASAVTLTMDGWTYGQNPAEPVLKNNIGAGTVNYSYAKVEGETYDISNLTFVSAKPKNAGNYVVKAEIGATENYASAIRTAEFTVAPKEAKLAWSRTSWTYTGSSVMPVCTVENLEAGDACDVVVTGGESMPGTYEATATGLSNANYVLPEKRTQSFTIWKRAQWIYIDEMAGWTYGDPANEPEIDDDSVYTTPVITYYKDKDCKQKTTKDDGAAKDGDVPSFAGTYYVKAEVPETEEYESDYDSFAFTIAKKTIGIAWTDTSLTYNGKEQAPTAAATDVVAGDTLTLTVSGAEKNAGSYTAEVTAIDGTAAKNYALPAKVTVSYKIAKLVATLKWGKTEFTYTGQDQVPTAEVTNLIGTDTCTVTVTGAATEVGEHTATVSKLSNSNYEIPEDAEQTFTIIKSDLPEGGENPVKLTMEGWTYGENAKEPVLENNIGGGTVTFSYAKLNENTEPSGYPALTYSTAKPKYAGAYVVKAVIGATGSYNECIRYSTFTIEQKTAELVWSDYDLVYNGDMQIPTCEVGNLENGDSCNVGLDGEASDAGKHTATATSLTNDNYKLPEAAAEKSLEFTISKAPLNLTVSLEGWTYGDEANKPSVEGNAGKGTETFTYYTDKACTEKTSKTDGAVEDGGVPADAGTYYLKADVAETKNYEAGTATTTFTISKADYLMDDSEKALKVKIDSWTYGDEAPDPVLVNEDSQASVRFGYAEISTFEEVEDHENLTYSVVKPVDFGLYIISAEVGATKNYNAARVFSAFLISQRVAELEWTELTFIYDGKDHIPVCTVKNLVKRDTCEVTVSGAASKAGEHEATAAALSNKNYRRPQTVTQKFSIFKDKPAPVVTLAGWTYGDKANTPSVEGNVEEGEVTYTYYTDEACTVKTTKDDGATVDGGVPACAGTYYVKADVAATENYEAGTSTAEFTIEKRTLTINWGDTGFVYKGEEQVPTATAANLVDGDEVTLTVSGAKKDAGRYTATVTAIEGKSAHDYVLPELVEQSFRINKKVAELKWGETEFTYNGKDQIPTVEVNNLVTGDTCEVTLMGAATAAGEHTATVVKLSNANYELPEEIQKKFTIKKADLTEAKVILDDWVYAESPKVPRVEGNVEGANVTYKYKAANASDTAYTTAVPTEAGTYTVMAVIDATAGYNGKTVTTDFMIDKAESKILSAPRALQGLVYCGGDQALIVEGVGFGGELLYAHEDNDTDAPEKEAFFDEMPVETHAGIHYVWYMVQGDKNHYDTKPVCIAVEIAKKQIVIKGIQAKDKTYDAKTTATLDFSKVVFGGIVEGDNLTIKAVGTFTSANAGKQTVNISNLVLGGESIADYELAAEGQQDTAEATIKQKAATVTPTKKQSKVYGEKDPTFTFTVTGLVSGEKLAGALAREKGNNAGTYKYTIGTLASKNKNYSVTLAKDADAFTIVKAKLTIKAVAKKSIYGKADAKLTYKVSGLVNGDTAAKAIKGELKRTGGKTAGTYKIVKGTLSAANYTISFTGAKYVIQKATWKAPSEKFKTTQATGQNRKNGKISGFKKAKTYQYSADGGKTWKKVTKKASINVKPGTYKIRYAADKNHKVGKAVTVKVTAKKAVYLGIKATQSGSKIKLNWNKISEADGYDVYIEYCGNKFTEPEETIEDNATTTLTLTKLDGTTISKTKPFHAYVVAYKMSGSKKVTVAKSITAHATGSKNTVYSNVKSLTLKKNPLTVKVGKTASIKASVTLVDTSKKHMGKDHGAKFRYISSDTSVVKVDKNGKVTGVGKGTCTVYVIAINGLMKKAKVTVQ